jgi:hypothetical protein
MKYQVTLNSANNYNVTFPRVERKKTVDVTSGGGGSKVLSELEDVNTDGRLNNYLLIWNATTQTYDHVPPSEVLDRSDGVNDGAIDYGTF